MFDYQEKKLMCHIKEVCTEECSWKFMLFLTHTCYTREFSKTNKSNLSFVLFSYSGGGELAVLNPV